MKKVKNNKKKPQKKAKRVESSRTGVIPLGDRVLVRPFLADKTSEETSFGIIIPDTVSKEMPGQGEVMAVGEGRFENGKRVPLSVKKGDKVVFSKYGYDEVKVDEEELYILKEDNILAVIKN